MNDKIEDNIIYKTEGFFLKKKYNENTIEKEDETEKRSGDIF